MHATIHHWDSKQDQNTETSSTARLQGIFCRIGFNPKDETQSTRSMQTAPCSVATKITKTENKFIVNLKRSGLGVTANLNLQPT